MTHHGFILNIQLTFTSWPYSCNLLKQASDFISRDFTADVVGVLSVQKWYFHHCIYCWESVYLCELFV